MKLTLEKMKKRVEYAGDFRLGMIFLNTQRFTHISDGQNIKLRTRAQGSKGKENLEL